VDKSGRPNVVARSGRVRVADEAIIDDHGTRLGAAVPLAADAHAG
jgi:hypothetical protein